MRRRVATAVSPAWILMLVAGTLPVSAEEKIEGSAVMVSFPAMFALGAAAVAARLGVLAQLARLPERSMSVTHTRTAR